MNKQPRIIDFNNNRNFFYQNSNTFNINNSTFIFNLYKSISKSETKFENIVFDLDDTIVIDSSSEIILESIQISTMNHGNNTATSSEKIAYINMRTLGFVLDIDEFEIKSTNTNNLNIDDKIFIPYTNYNYNNGTLGSSDSSHGYSYYNNSGPLKNNYISNIKPKKINKLTITIQRLEGSNSPGGDLTLKDLFTNEDDKSGEPAENGGDIMLVIAINNLPSASVSQDKINNVFMNPQNNLMNIPNEYELFKLQKERNQQQFNQQQFNQQQFN